MVNIVSELNRTYTYKEIARRILDRTGRVYSEGHIGNVARGSQKLSDALQFNLERAFPEFFLKSNSTTVEHHSLSIQDRPS